MRPKNSPGLPAWKGDACKLRRVLAGWSVERLANEIGVSKSTLSRWEANNHTPTSEKVVALAEALDVPRTVFAHEPRIV